MKLGVAFRALSGAYLIREKGRTLLTILGVALGVAVLVAIEMANASAVASFRGALSDVAGRASLTVRGNGGGVPPEFIARLASAPGVRAASPLITDDVVFTPKNGTPAESLVLVGADLLMTSEHSGDPVRDLRFDVAPGTSYTEFITNPNVLVMTRAFADRHALRVGDSVTLSIAGRAHTATIGGLLSGGNFATAFDGNVIVTDIGIADALLRRGGLVDRIDITLDEGADPEEVASALEKLVTPDIMIERPETRGKRVDDMLAAFRFNLAALGHVSLLVGAFLIYNTMSIAVVRRRPAIGTLRALGASRMIVRSVFLLEGAITGLIGGVLGIVSGIGLAKAILAPMSEAISINFVRTEGSQLLIEPRFLVIALLLGIATAVLAAFGPAQEAAATPPANTMRRGSMGSGRGTLGAMVAVGAAMLAGAGALLMREPRSGIPIEGYAAATLAVLAFVVWSRPGLALATRMLRGPFTRYFGAEGLLAVTGTQGALKRASVAIGGLLMSLAMCVSVVVMVSSFRTTVVTWMEQVLLADLYVAAASNDVATRPPALTAEFAEAVSAIPGVAGADSFRARRIVYNGREAWLAAGRFDLARFSNLDLKGRDAATVLAGARANEEVIVSEAFARKNNVNEGDMLTFPISGGTATRRVASIYFDYSTEQGFIVMDRSLYLKFFDDALVDSVALYLEPGANRRAIIDEMNRLSATLANMPAVTVRANDELRAFAIGAFDRTFRLTWALQIIAIIVAVLGVTTTLLAQILDRKHEVTTLRYIGAAKRRVARIVLLEASLIGGVGVIFGVVAGLALSWILTNVIMLQSFGWTIHYEVAWWGVGRAAVIVFAATLAAGVLSSREASRGTGDSSRTMVG